MADLEAAPEDKRLYIESKLNPLLDGLVAECIRSEPDNPVLFMLQWLEYKKASDEDSALREADKELLIKENSAMEHELAKLKANWTEAARAVAAEANQGIPEEPDDDELDEPPPGWEDQLPSRSRNSVCAEPAGTGRRSFVAPVIPKTAAQKERLKDVLPKCFLFSGLDGDEMITIINAMKLVCTGVGEQIVRQGDSGDALFMIESGTVECTVKKTDGDPKVRTCGAGEVFGELALLYNCPRGASVESKTTCVLWELDRSTFNHIVKDAAQQKRARYETFLSKVPLLQYMDAYERSQLVDALRGEAATDGQVIVQEGALDKRFYIVEEGEAIATKQGVPVMTYGIGDCFGELALLREQQRAATVTCKGAAKLLSLDEISFKRLVDVSRLLERSHLYT